MKIILILTALLSISFSAAFTAATVNGQLLKKMESQYLTATDFSKLK